VFQFLRELTVWHINRRTDRQTRGQTEEYLLRLPQLAHRTRKGGNCDALQLEAARLQSFLASITRLQATLKFNNSARDIWAIGHMCQVSVFWPNLYCACPETRASGQNYDTAAGFSDPYFLKEGRYFAIIRQSFESFFHSTDRKSAIFLFPVSLT